MPVRSGWARALAIAGTALVWLALLAPLVSPLWVILQRGFFVLGLLAAGLLFVSALVARRYRAVMAAGLTVALLAMLLHLALMREWDPIVSVGPALAGLVLALYVTYLVSQVALGVCGFLLIRLMGTVAQAGA